MLSGVVVGTRLGVSATVLYVIAYLLMNLARVCRGSAPGGRYR